jgi:hypothetical protein
MNEIKLKTVLIFSFTIRFFISLDTTEINSSSASKAANPRGMGEKTVRY